MMHNNICITGIPERDERDQGIENQFVEIMTENFPNLVKTEDTQVQKAQRVPNSINPKRPTRRHVMIKMAKIKDREF